MLSATSTTQFASILANKLPTVAKFGNNRTCPPCAASAPIFKALGDKHCKRCNIVDVDLGTQQELGQKYGISSMPTFIYFVDGHIVNTVVGAQDLESTVATFVEKHGKTLVFESSQGHSLGGSTSTNIPLGRDGRPNPWASKPATKPKANPAPVNHHKEIPAEGDEDKDGDVVCDGDMCYFVPNEKK